MTKREEYEKKTEQLIDEILDPKYELVDVEYVKEGGNYILRIYVDKEGGIAIDDCVEISRCLSDKLDEKDYIPDSYVLEVSSPGLGRQLKKEKDFKRSIGKEVEVKLYKAVNKMKDYVGILVSYDDTKIQLETEAGVNLEFSRTDISLIRLTIKF